LERGNRPAREDLPEVCFRLFERPEREWAYVALELLRLERKTLEYNDLEWLMELVRTRSWWDTVDILASDMVSRTLLRHPERWEEFLVPLMESENGWENRTAMIAQLRWKKETHTELLEQALVAHLESKWFFHRKAVGWALREYRKTDPHWVADFVDRHGEHMSGLSRREALR
jgi:3-methyladenine DNA glycosylase AlkD